MLVVGLTGNIASGKSTVSRLLSARGATIVDSDALARRAVERGTRGLERIAAQWGQRVLTADGDLDRAALRAIVFEHAGERERLNEIVHPEVERMRDQLLREARERGDRVVVCDIPLLFERGLSDRFDRIVLVDAPRALRLERLVRDRGLSETDAAAMIDAQMPSEAKRPSADIIIDNAGTLAELEARVADAWEALLRAERDAAGVV